MASGKRLTLYADFGQIHVRDPKGKSSLEEAWTAAATDDRIADGGDIVGIGLALWDPDTSRRSSS